MSNSILSDIDLGETPLRDLSKRYVPVTIIDEDLKVGKKYLCIINESVDEVPINLDVKLKNSCCCILRYKGQKNLAYEFGYNFDVLEESIRRCRLMHPPEVGKEYFISAHDMDSDGVLLYYYDKEHIMKPFTKRTIEQLPIPEDLHKETFKYLYNTTNGGKMRKTRKRNKSHKSKPRKNRKRLSRKIK